MKCNDCNKDFASNFLRPYEISEFIENKSWELKEVAREMKPVDFAFKIECWMLSLFVTVFPTPHRPIELLYSALIRILWLLPDLTEVA